MGQFVTATHTTHTSLKMVLKSCLAVALVCGVKAAPQFNGDSSLARILQEQRFNMGDGKFGAAYAQEDGVAFKEESTGNNERIGQYSYIDENGNNIVVNYSNLCQGLPQGSDQARQIPPGIQLSVPIISNHH